MTGKAGVLFISVLLSIASGCTSRPVFSVEVYSTPTPYDLFPNASPVASIEPVLPVITSPSPAPVVTAVPAFTVAPAILPADFSPILYGEKYDSKTFFLLLGGVQAGKWLTSEQAAALIPGTSEYDIHTSAQDLFQVLGYAPESSPIHPDLYTIGSDINRDDFGMLGVAHGWPVRQAQAEELSSENETYRQIVLDWLKDAGVSNPLLDSLRIFRVDLEGDGTDEIVISATRLDESLHTSQAGDYAIVLIRKVVGDEVVTLPVVADIYHSKERQVDFPRKYSLASFLDLNQDGVLEVVVDFHRWEGDGALIYTIQGRDIAQVP